MDVNTITDNIVKPIANTLAVAVAPVHVHLELNSVKFNNVLAVLNVRDLLQLPVIFPQITVCMAKLHILSSSGRPVQVTLV